MAHGETTPARGAVAITPSDSVNLRNTTRAIYCGSTGDISVEMESGDSAVIFIGVLTGQVLPIRVSRVNSTNTTATNLVALF